MAVYVPQTWNNDDPATPLSGSRMTHIELGVKANADELETKADAVHAHAISDVTNLQTTLDGKQASGDYATNTTVTSGLAGKANTTHTHAQTDVVGLADSLATKQEAGDYATNTALTNGLSGKSDLAHTHTASNISDSTTVGRSVVTAVDAPAARTAIGAGTSSLVIGTTAGTAKEGNYAPTKSDVGLGNVDNTSDMAKPISTATQTALDSKVGSDGTVLNHIVITQAAFDALPSPRPSTTIYEIVG